MAQMCLYALPLKQTMAKAMIAGNNEYTLLEQSRHYRFDRWDRSSAMHMQTEKALRASPGIEFVLLNSMVALSSGTVRAYLNFVRLDFFFAEVSLCSSNTGEY